MLLEFSFRNFFSFKEGATISFKVSENCPELISRNRDFVTLMGVKGANGSGKTNVLKAMSFLSYFVSKSFKSDPNEEIPLKLFFNSRKNAEFLVEFVCNDVHYVYELVVDEKIVKSEVIYRKFKRKTRLVERVNDEVVYATDEYSELKKIKLRSNVSLVSMANQHENSELKDVFSFFNSWMSNVSYRGLNEKGPSIYTISKILHEDIDYLNFVSEFISSCDGGVSEVKIKNVVDEKGESIFVPVFIHENAGKKHEVFHILESSGTKSLFKNLLYYKVTLDEGGVLLLDEFDINLHAHILPKLLSLFDDPDINKKNAQLVFSTHNGEVLDWLGKYRSYLVNKENNESYAYRLDEIPDVVLRNDRPIYPVYNRGDIGGVPKI